MKSLKVFREFSISLHEKDWKVNATIPFYRTINNHLTLNFEIKQISKAFLSLGSLRCK